MATQTEIFLVRHGEPTLQSALLGSTDSPLSENGWQQLNDTLAGLSKIDHIVSSPLSRCAHFAQDYAEQAQLPLQINQDWRECHFGDWDGERYKALHQKYPLEVSAFFSDPANNTPPNGEKLTDFSLRTKRALLKLHQDFQGSSVLVLTHAGVIRNIVAWCLQIDYLSGFQFRRFAIDYASVTHLSIYQEDKLYPQLMTVNWKRSNPQSNALLSGSEE
ncbi:histidine phosphatase family protein [Aliikangiella marina]|uniref:Histidine phosphatase family protein n=1 Tax=Aliikangiella marina TaxID=1712262 RepID=A0A545TCP8_9GAMM|nr:histidine phosphatase family protein [Aliikangiella marina]TQV74994.1 histidine phosphatase family protein [Aliikangiella marina]